MKIKNPFKMRTLTPALLFIQSALTLAFGITCIANSDFAFFALSWFAAGSLIIAGLSRSWGLFCEKKMLHGTITLGTALALALIIFFYPMLVAASAGRLFGIWFLITGGAQATICIQCIVQNLRGKVRAGISASFSLIFGLLLIFQPQLQMRSVFVISGIYLIITAITLLIDGFSEILLFGTAGARVKNKIRISLPLFVTALLPGKLLDDFNQYFKTNPTEAAKQIKDYKAPASTNDTPMEVYIHLSDKGAQRTGHIDLRYHDTVYSYGCYDHHAHKFGGMVSDGTFVMCEREKYIDYCTRAEEKILVGFGLALSEEQSKAVERELTKITSHMVSWKSDFEKGVADMKNPDAASGLISETGARIFKVTSGPFRKYYTLNTNCVKLADQIIGTSGIGLINVNGIAVPGSYYAMLNELYELKDSLVTTRNIYKYTKAR